MPDIIKRNDSFKKLSFILIVFVAGCDTAPSGDVWQDEPAGRTEACVQDCDEDRDGVVDVHDNCPTITNAEQADADGDGAGDLCDEDPFRFDVRLNQGTTFLVHTMRDESFSLKSRTRRTRHESISGNLRLLVDERP